MAPIRRYLRISAYSVLEVRIYLDNPADAYRWLLRTRDPVLPQVIEAVRPYVLPKLREENERAKKVGKRKGFKDVVHGEGFEVSIFLTELSSPHSILTRDKHFAQKPTVVGGSRAAPLEIDDEEAPPILREESDDEKISMEDIPSFVEFHAQDASEPIHIQDDDADEHDHGEQARTLERDVEKDEKKKMGLSTVYDGFQIYGRILCLVVKRRDGPKGKQPMAGGHQTMVENWISSTQANENEITHVE